MDNKIMVSIDDLKNVLETLKNQKEILSNEHNNSINSILETSKTCFAVGNIDISEISDGFNKVFAEIENGLGELINVLDNNVIKNYSELAESLKAMFNDQVKSQLSELLK